MKHPHRVLIIGAGIYGSTLADHLSRLGHHVTLIDKGDAVSKRNSSTGETRLFRMTILEDPKYTRFARTSLRYFEELQAETAANLRTTTGFAIVANPGARAQRHHSIRNVVDAASRVASTQSIEYEAMQGSHLEARFPALSLDPNAAVFYEPNASVLHVDAISDAIFNRLRSRDVDLLLNETVSSVHPQNGAVTLTTAGGREIVGDLAVLATGADPLGLARQSMVIPQPAHWYQSNADGDYPALVLTKPHTPLLFGFPKLPGTRGAKFVHENAVPRRATLQDGAPSSWESRLDATLDIAVQRVVRNLGPKIQDGWSPYVVMPGARMVVHQRAREILQVACCSGHGYKLSAGITSQIATSINKGRIQDALME